MKSMSVGRWFKGITMPAAGNLGVLAQILNVRHEWLASGQGVMVETAAVNESGETVNIVVRELPRLDPSQIDDWLGGLISPPKNAVVAGSLGDRSFVLEMPDNSLSPKVPKGASPVIDPDMPATSDLPVIARSGTGYVFGIPVLRPDVLIIEPINPSYPTNQLSPSALVGVIIGLAQTFF